MGGNRYNIDTDANREGNADDKREFDRVEGEASTIVNDYNHSKFDLQKWLGSVEKPNKKLFKNCPEFKITKEDMAECFDLF